MKKKSKTPAGTVNAIPECPPGFMKEPFIVPIEANNALVLYHAYVKPLLENPDTLIAIKDAPDSKDIINRCLVQPEAKVPDEELFNFLAANPIFLKARFTQEKVTRWQKEMYDQDSVKAFKAQENLRRIGITLALKRIERREQEHVVYAQYKNILERVKGVSKYRSHALRRRSLREIYGDSVVDQLGDIFPPTDRKLAIKLTAQHLGLRESTVETYIKRMRYEEIKIGPFKAIRLKARKKH